MPRDHRVGVSSPPPIPKAEAAAVDADWTRLDLLEHGILPPEFVPGGDLRAEELRRVAALTEFSLALAAGAFAPARGTRVALEREDWPALGRKQKDTM